MISRFQAGMKKRSICSGVAWLSSVGRNIPKWRSKGSGLLGCTQLGHAGRGRTEKKSKWEFGKGKAGDALRIFDGCNITGGLKQCEMIEERMVDKFCFLIPQEGLWVRIDMVQISKKLG